MWRLVLILAAGFLVANTTGLLPEADDTACADEGEGKQCPPTCPTCTCAWHSLKTAVSPAIDIRPVDLTSCTVEPPAPDEAHGQLVPPPTTRPPIV